MMMTRHRGQTSVKLRANPEILDQRWGYGLIAGFSLRQVSTIWRRATGLNVSLMVYRNSHDEANAYKTRWRLIDGTNSSVSHAWIRTTLHLATLPPRTDVILVGRSALISVFHAQSWATFRVCVILPTLTILRAKSRIRMDQGSSSGAFCATFAANRCIWVSCG